MKLETIQHSKTFVYRSIQYNSNSVLGTVRRMQLWDYDWFRVALTLFILAFVVVFIVYPFLKWVRKNRSKISSWIYRYFNV